jgi:UrcA family protein
VVVALVIGAASGSASAQPSDHGRVPVVIRVPIGDLDLNRQAGADELLKRVARAASHACGGQPALGVMMPEIARAFAACKAQALNQAVATIDAPMVRERYAARTRGSPVRLAQAKR